MAVTTARVLLGADVWEVLVATAAGLDLPAPFAPTAVPDPAAEAALRRSPLVPGTSGDLLADLHPSVRASLLVHLLPRALLDVAVGTTRARFAVGTALASGLVRTGGGPVTLLTLLPDDVAAQAAALLPGLGAAPAREELRVDAAVAVAAARSRPELAALLDGVGPVTATARLQVGPQLLLGVRADDGWRSARLDGGDLVLRPVDADALVTDLAGALAGVLA